jgi:hypothetical protein
MLSPMQATDSDDIRETTVMRSSTRPRIGAVDKVGMTAREQRGGRSLRRATCRGGA